MHCASEPNCKLNISSFLTLAYPLDCLTCAKDITVTVLLQEMMWGWESWLTYFLFFCPVVNCSFMAGT